MIDVADAAAAAAAAAAAEIPRYLHFLLVDQNQQPL